MRKQLTEQGISLDISPEAMDMIGDKGYDHHFGARPLRRQIQTLIEDPLAEGLLDGKFMTGQTIRVDVDVENDNLTLTPVEELAAV